MPSTVPPRNKIDRKTTWNAESVFPSNEAREKEVRQIVDDSSIVKKYQARLAIWHGRPRRQDIAR